MSFSDIEQKRIEKALAAFLERNRPPVHIRSKLDISYRQSGQSIELFEIHSEPGTRARIREFPFAKATYVRTQRVWKLYWLRGDLKWHSYKPAPTARTIEALLDLVQIDEYACFFG